MNYKKKNSLIIVLLIAIMGCGVSSENDIYKKIPKKSTLTKDVLKYAEQIILNESDLIVRYNLLNGWYDYNNHLLFYNKDLQLYGANYFPSLQIDSLENDIIFGNLHQNNDRRKWQFRDELPVKYKTKFIRNTTKVDGGGRISNKIIDSMELVPKTNIVKLFVRKSKNRYLGLRPIEKINVNQFTILDTINYSLFELNFIYNQGQIVTKYIDDRNYFIRDYLLVSDSTILDEFYDKLLKAN